MSNPKAFTSYIENEYKLNMLTDEQAGRLYKSLFAYSRTGEKPDFSDDPVLAYAFIDFTMDIDRDREKYEQTCQRRSEAGKKGSQAKQANADFTKQTQAKQANAEFAKQTQAKQANADFACEEEANTSKSSKAKTKTKTKAKVYTNVYTEGDRPDFEERAEKVISDFKRICTGLVKPEKLTDHRRRLIYQAEADGVDFTELFERAQQSDFLTGRDGKGGGFGFDWVLEPKNRQKIIEGNYNNRGQPAKSVNSLKGASFDLEAYKRTSLFDD